MRHGFGFLFFGSAIVLATGLVASSCADGGEGDACSTLNGNDDCQDGLVCKDKDNVHYTHDVCCPQAVQLATTPVCAEQVGSVVSEGGLPPEGGTADTGAPPSDTGTRDTGAADTGLRDTAAPLSDGATEGG